MRRLLPRLAAALISLPSLAAAATDASPSTPAFSASTKPIFEEWVLITLGGRTCGFGSTITTAHSLPQGSGYETKTQEEFVARRLGVAVKLNEASDVIEDAKGVVLSFDQDSSGSGSDIHLHGRRDGDDLVVSSRGQTQRLHVPPLAALGPEAVRRLIDAVPLVAGTTFSFDTFSTDYPKAAAVERGTVVGRTSHSVGGQSRLLWKITSEVPAMPGVTSVTWVDDKNNDVETDVTIPGFGELKQIVSDRATCMKQPEGAEIFAGSLIAPQRPLRNLAHQRQAIYRIDTGGSREIGLWNSGEQRVLASRPGESEIEVTVPSWRPEDAGYELPCPDSPALHDFLQPTAYLESNSPEVKQLAHEALDGERNPVRAAHLIEKFVEAYITKKDLNIGFASAEETARSREGDCTEHAVLCAAIGRAAGLPTRCVLGLGYIPPGELEPTISNAVSSRTGLFGFHMWAEADIGDDRWVPMDAALGGFDVGHITFFKSALADVDPLVDLNLPILNLIQNLHVTVIRTVPKDSPPPPSGALPELAPATAPLLQAPASLPAVTPTTNAAPALPPAPPLPPGID